MSLINIVILAFAVADVFFAIGDFRKYSYPRNFRYLQGVTGLVIALGVALCALFNSILIDFCGIALAVIAFIVQTYLLYRYLTEQIHDYKDGKQ